MRGTDWLRAFSSRDRRSKARLKTRPTELIGMDEKTTKRYVGSDYLDE